MEGLWEGGMDSSAREEDLLISMARVSLLMRKQLPPNAKISEEATDAMRECVSEFIAHVTKEANEIRKMERREVLTADDLITAMSSLGLADYAAALATFLQKFKNQMES